MTWSVKFSDTFLEALEEADSRLADLYYESLSRPFQREHDNEIKEVLDDDKAFGLLIESLRHLSPDQLRPAKDFHGENLAPEYRELAVPPWHAYFFLDENSQPVFCSALTLLHNHDISEKLADDLQEAERLCRTD